MANITLKRNGQVLADGKLIGNYSVDHPWQRYGRGFVKNMFYFKGLNGREMADYTRKDIVRAISDNYERGEL